MDLMNLDCIIDCDDERDETRNSVKRRVIYLIKWEVRIKPNLEAGTFFETLAHSLS